MEQVTAHPRSVDPDIEIYLQDFVHSVESGGYYSYKGSLTTPGYVSFRHIHCVEKQRITSYYNHTDR